MPQICSRPILKQETTSSRMIFTLGVGGCVAAVLIVLAFKLTLARIEEQQKAYLEQCVYLVLPGTVAMQPYEVMTDGNLVKSDGKAKGKQYVYAGYDKENALTGVAINSSGQGFQESINVLYGYSIENQCIVGMQVLASKETPGLGDKIYKDDDFKANFNDLDVSYDAEKAQIINPIKVVKKGEKKNKWEIDAITGATISSKAIGKILRDSSTQMAPVILSRENLQRLKERQ